MLFNSSLLFLIVASLVAVATSDQSKWGQYEAMVQAMESNSMLEDVWDKDHAPKFKGGKSQSIPEGVRSCYQVR